MKAVAKILIEFETHDAIAARQRLHSLAEAVLPVLPEEGQLREFKMTEVGSGRLIEKIDSEH